MSTTYISDEETVECPLCMEEIDLIDRNFKPCSCGYQICRFCWHHILEDLNGLCPACRRHYSEETVEFTPIPQAKLASIKAKKRAKEREKKEQELNARKHLSNVRVVQKNLVYVIGIPAKIATEETLRQHDYFGQYGKITKVVINKRNHTTPQGSSTNFGIYITYARKEDATKAINAVDGTVCEGRNIKASYGTTKYCTNYLKGQACQNPNCMYLHEPGEEADSYVKEKDESLNGSNANKHHLKDSQSTKSSFPYAREASFKVITSSSSSVKDDKEEVSALPVTASWAKLTKSSSSSSSLNSKSQTKTIKQDKENEITNNKVYSINSNQVHLQKSVSAKTSSMSKLDHKQKISTSMSQQSLSSSNISNTNISSSNSSISNLNSKILSNMSSSSNILSASSSKDMPDSQIPSTTTTNTAASTPLTGSDEDLTNPSISTKTNRHVNDHQSNEPSTTVIPSTLATKDEHPLSTVTANESVASTNASVSISTTMPTSATTTTTTPEIIKTTTSSSTTAATTANTNASTASTITISTISVASVVKATPATTTKGITTTTTTTNPSISSAEIKVTDPTSATTPPSHTTDKSTKKSLKEIEKLFDDIYIGSSALCDKNIENNDIIPTNIVNVISRKYEGPFNPFCEDPFHFTEEEIIAALSRLQQNPRNQYEMALQYLSQNVNTNALKNAERYQKMYPNQPISSIPIKDILSPELLPENKLNRMMSSTNSANTIPSINNIIKRKLSNPDEVRNMFNNQNNGGYPTSLSATTTSSNLSLSGGINDNWIDMANMQQNPQQYQQNLQSLVLNNATNMNDINGLPSAMMNNLSRGNTNIQANQYNTNTSNYNTIQQHLHNLQQQGITGNNNGGSINTNSLNYVNSMLSPEMEYQNSLQYQNYNNISQQQQQQQQQQRQQQQQQQMYMTNHHPSQQQQLYQRMNNSSNSTSNSQISNEYFGQMLHQKQNGQPHGPSSMMNIPFQDPAIMAVRMSGNGQAASPYDAINSASSQGLSPIEYLSSLNNNIHNRNNKK